MAAVSSATHATRRPVRMMERLDILRACECGEVESILSMDTRSALTCSSQLEMKKGARTVRVVFGNHLAVLTTLCSQ